MVKKYEIHYKVNIESNEQIIPPKFKFYEKLMLWSTIPTLSRIRTATSHLKS